MLGSKDVGASLVDAQSSVAARNGGDHKGRPYIPDGFKMTALGPLPEEWQVVRLGEVADFSGRIGKHYVTDTSLIPFIPMSLLPADALYITKWEMRQPADVRSGLFIQEGNLLLAKITPCLENGKQGIVSGLPGGWGYATTEVIPIRPSSGLDSEYLALYLKMPNVRQSLASKMEGTTGRQRLPKTVVQALPIPLPPLPEQRAIAYVLSTIQRAVEAQDKIIAAARELKKSLMRHLFTYGPVPPAQADQVALKETEIGPVLEHWEVKPLGEIATLQRGKDLPIQNRVAGVYPIIGSNGIIGYHNEYFLEGEGVVTGRSGTIGKVTYIEGRYWAHNTALYVKNFHSNYPKFVYYLLQQLDFSKYIAGVSVPTLNRNLVHPVPTALPPFAEQREIARILQAVDRKIEAEERRKAALQTLFKTTLHHLMTGRIRCA